MREVYIVDGEVRTFTPIAPMQCTGVAARWCPIHGDCTDKGDEAELPYSAHCSEYDCPLHGERSTHAEGKNRDTSGDASRVLGGAK